MRLGLGGMGFRGRGHAYGADFRFSIADCGLRATSRQRDRNTERRRRKAEGSREDEGRGDEWAKAETHGGFPLGGDAHWGRCVGGRCSERKADYATMLTGKSSGASACT
jgi:hypothetical protein